MPPTDPKAGGGKTPADLPANSFESYKGAPEQREYPDTDATEQLHSQWSLFWEKDESSRETLDRINREREQIRHALEKSAPAFSFHRLLGIGGNGEIWEATQHSLIRLIAVKKIRPDILEKFTDETKRDILIRFFQQEALTTASLQHPNIIPIHDLGRDEHGHPLIAMQRIKGRLWHDVILEDDGMDPYDFYAKHLRILIDVGQAIAYAHSRGVIHRDVKPTQVMIGEFGEAVVMDWGLAYHFDKDRNAPSPLPMTLSQTLSMASNPAGTPCYMAPEQTHNTLDNLGPWTDVFLLGATLYFLLTGTPPHNHSDSKTAFEHAEIADIQPPAERATDRDIPPELAALAMQAMEADPGERPGSAKKFVALIEDYLFGAGRRREAHAMLDEVEDRLQAGADGYQEYEELLQELSRAQLLWPERRRNATIKDRVLSGFVELALSNDDLILARIHARDINDEKLRQEQMQKITKAKKINTRRERERKLAFAGAFIMLIVIIAGGIKYARDQKAALLAAKEARHHAETMQLDAMKQRNIARNAQLNAEYEQYVTAIGFADAYLDAHRANKARDLIFHRTPAYLRNVEWGRLIAKLYPDDMIVVTGKPLAELHGSAISPDGSLIASGNRLGELSVFDATTGRRLYSKNIHQKGIWSVSFSPSGNRILTASFDQTARIIDSKTGAATLTLEGHTDILRESAFSNDGRWAATTSLDHSLRIWDATTGELKQRVQFEFAPYSLAFTPDGSRVAVGVLAPKAYLVDVETGAVEREYDVATGDVHGLCIDSSGERLAAMTGNGVAHIFDIRSGERRLTIDNKTSLLRDGYFSPDGSMLVTTDDEGVCRLWNGATGELIRELNISPSLYNVQFTNDGSYMIVNSESELRLFDMSRIIPVTKSAPDDIPAENISGYHRAISFPFHLKGLWEDMDSAWLENNGRTHLKVGDRIYRIDSFYSAFSPDGEQRIQIDPRNFSAQLFKKGVESPQSLRTGSSCYSAAFSSSGQLAATGTMSGLVQVWDTRSWKQVARYHIEERHSVWSLLFTPDDRGLLFGHVLGGMTMLDLQEMRVAYRIEPHDKAVSILRLSPDGRRFLSGSSDGNAAVFDVATGTQITMMTGHSQFLYSAEWSPDGMRVITASNDGSVKIWDAETGRELLTVYESDRVYGIMGAFFSDNGRRTVIVQPTGSLIEMENLPWDVTAYPDSPGASLEEKIELWKRRKRHNAKIDWSDITWGSEKTKDEMDEADREGEANKI